MTLHRPLLILTTAALFSLCELSSAAAPHTYQVTGPIVQMSDTSITVQKAANDNWEISRDATTKITGDLKVGSKVTVEYYMTATKATAKEDKAAAAKAPATPAAADTATTTAPGKPAEKPKAKAK